MGKRIDLTGQVFDRLTVIEFAGVSKSGEATWLCQCVCGNTAVARGSKLKAKQNRSCGCMKAEDKHGHSYRGKRTRTYSIWCAMRSRCNNPNVPCYSRYGGRGIVVCERWNTDFIYFLEDMGEAPDGMSIDRIDNDKGYCPENCRWATTKEQSRNTRQNRFIEFNGKTQTLVDWSEELNIPYARLSRRLNALGWDDQKALTTP